MASPEATFDTLFIVARLQEPLHGVTAGEIQLFGYLASLLGVFRGAPSAEWGYSFARTSYGAPYCVDLSEALDDFVATGLLDAQVKDPAAVFLMTAEGRALWGPLSELEELQQRKPLLEAAC